MVNIRDAAAEDAKAIVDIYNHFVLSSTITFEIEPVTPETIASRIESVHEAGLPWRVLVNDGQLSGYAYATKWRERLAYRFSVESTIYLAPHQTNGGRGTLLYMDLIQELRCRPIHAVIGGIALPNDASIGLHEKLGFEQVAHFRQVGRKFDQWVDVGYWELILANAQAVG